MPDTGENTAPEGEQEPTGQEQQPATGDEAQDEPLGEGGKKALDAERARAAELDKQLKAAQRELQKAKQASMSDAEKAVTEAEEKGRTAAMAEFGKRLAKAELNTAAAKRNPDFDTAALEYVDLSRFIGDDGEPDAKAIAAAVERLVPAPNGAPSFDGGVRGSSPKAGDMNQLLRQAAGRA